MAQRQDRPHICVRRQHGFPSPVQDTNKADEASPYLVDFGRLISGGMAWSSLGFDVGFIRVVCRRAYSDRSVGLADDLPSAAIYHQLVLSLVGVLHSTAGT